MTYSSKAAQKEALQDLGRRYENEVDEVLRTELLTIPSGDRQENFDDLYYYVPALHTVSEKRMNKYLPEYSNLVALAFELKAERDAVKNTEIAPKKEKSQEVKIEEAIIADIKKGLTIGQEIDLARYLKGKAKNITANVDWHMVTNAHGTEFIRLNYFLNGSRMALAKILYIAQEA